MDANRWREVAERRVAERAGAWHGVLSPDELVECGWSATTLRRRIADGRAHWMFPGAVAIGYLPEARVSWFRAATLSVEGVLCGRSFAEHWGFLPPKPRTPVEATGRRRRKASGLISREVRFAAEDTVLHDRVPVLLPAPGLLHLAEVVPYRELRRAVNQALVLRRVSLPQLVACAATYPGRRGARPLLRVVATAKPTRSVFEDLLADHLAHAGLAFETNVRIAGAEFDVVFPDARVIVEADGGAFHDNPVAAADDAAKQARAEAAGWTVMRLRWRDVTEPARRSALTRHLVARGCGTP